MKKSIIILTAIALIAGGCGQKKSKQQTDEANSETPQIITETCLIEKDNCSGDCYCSEDIGWYAWQAAERFEKLGIKQISISAEQRYLSFPLDNGENYIVDTKDFCFADNALLYKKGKKPMPLSTFDLGFNNNEQEWEKIAKYLEMKLSEVMILLDGYYLEDNIDYSPVSDEEIALIAPVIKKWTDYVGVDFSQANFVSSESKCLNCKPDKGSQFYWAFSENDDSDNFRDFDYSPNKQRYIDLIYSYERNGNYYWQTWQGVEAIYLTDRAKRTKNAILYTDNLKGMPDAVFWKSNDIFIIVGCENYTPEKTSFQVYVYVFDIAAQTVNYYEIAKELKLEDIYYLEEVTLKEKNILATGGDSYGDGQ